MFSKFVFFCKKENFKNNLIRNRRLKKCILRKYSFFVYNGCNSKKCVRVIYHKSVFAIIRYICTYIFILYHYVYMVCWGHTCRKRTTPNGGPMGWPPVHHEFKNKKDTSSWKKRKSTISQFLLSRNFISFHVIKSWFQEIVGFAPKLAKMSFVDVKMDFKTKR